MAEYIDKQAFLDHMRGTNRYFNVKCDIESFPAADVAPVVHGKDLASPSLFECSVCGCEDDDTYTCDVTEYHYCPNCGAKIDEKEEKK